MSNSSISLFAKMPNPIEKLDNILLKVANNSFSDTNFLSNN